MTILKCPGKMPPILEMSFANYSIYGKTHDIGFCRNILTLLTCHVVIVATMIFFYVCITNEYEYKVV